MLITRLLVILTTLAVAAPAAHADYADDAAAGLQVVKGAIDRTRRGIAIGPEVGYAGGSDLDGHGMQGVSFGIGLYTFDVPTAFDLQGIIAAKIRARVEDRVKQIVASGGAPPADLGVLAQEVTADVKAEVMGQKVERRHAFEKPAWKVVLEGTKLVSAGGGFQTRFVVGKGIRHTSYGLGVAVQRANSDTAVFLGPEIAFHLTPIGEQRTPVLDLLVRGELGLGSSASDRPFVIAVGARVLVDLL
jgi:hypothetical protein